MVHLRKERRSALENNNHLNRSESRRVASQRSRRVTSQQCGACAPLGASGGFDSAMRRFESCRPRHIERPVRHPARSSAPGPSVEILAVAGYSPRRISNANSLCCAFSANSANIPAAARADFYPDGFRSSRLICPASQSSLHRLLCESGSKRHGTAPFRGSGLVTVCGICARDAIPASSLRGQVLVSRC